MRRQIKLARGVGTLAVGVAVGSIGQVDRRGKQANHTSGRKGGDPSIRVRLLSVCSDGENDSGATAAYRHGRRGTRGGEGRSDVSLRGGAGGSAGEPSCAWIRQGCTCYLAAA